MFAEVGRKKQVLRLGLSIFQVVNRLNSHNITRHIFNLGLKKKSKELTVGLVSKNTIKNHITRPIIYFELRYC